MRSNFARFLLVLTIMAIPVLPGPLMVRLGTLIVCLSCSLALGARWYRRQGAKELARPTVDHAPADRVTALCGPAGQGETVHRLSHQLREVVQLTEEAALEINERVIRIIGRARAQLQSLTDVVSGLARERVESGNGPPRDLLRMIETMAAETASLSKDVNGVILSLQFQDLTKQRLEQVIEELQRLYGELAMLKVHEVGAREASRRPSIPAARTGRPEGSGEQGESDGKDLSDRG